jgi:hypothetical protein
VADPFTNIAAHLPEMARLQPETPALFSPAGHHPDGSPCYTSTSYRQLDAESDCLAHSRERFDIVDTVGRGNGPFQRGGDEAPHQSGIGPDIDGGNGNRRIFTSGKLADIEAA